MKKGQVSIILPENLYLLKGSSNPYGPYGIHSPQGQAQYDLQYKNFIYPYKESYEVECNCEYGVQYNTFWRFDGVCDKEGFPLELYVYDNFGELVAEKKTMVHMVSVHQKTRSLLCIGDSMTRSGGYISQVVQMLPKIKTIGLKCYDGEHFCEGRGGWHSAHYFSMSEERAGFSPFLFPKTVPGEKYLGDAVFWKQVWTDSPESYACVGMQKAAAYFGMTEFDEESFPVMAEEGDVVKNKSLFRYEKGKWVPMEAEFAFDFVKYMKRNGGFLGVEKPDVVSVLLGANDFYNVPYHETESKIKTVIGRYETLAGSIKSFDPDIKIIFNLPVLGAGTSYPEAQKAVGVKRYCYNILSFCEKILEKWDNEEAAKQGIYVCPMMNFLDMEKGFQKEYIQKSKYSEELLPVYTNWLHPSSNGYKQMGNILAGVVAQCMCSE